jgi:GT2 family glycosyltransferase
LNGFAVSISAIIVNYNSGDYLKASVGSLLRMADPVQIIVVDNNSKDHSLDSVLGDDKITVIQNPDNLGFAVACNIGTRVATGAHVFYLNPDCEFEASALHRLIEVLHSDPTIGMVGGLILGADGKEQAGARRAIPTPWRSFVRAFGLTVFSKRWPRLFYDFHLHKQPLPSQPIEVEAISGACMLVRREALNDVGLWDEGYFLHCEDLDWCMRFRQKAWKIMFVPDAVISHAKGVSSSARPGFVEWHKHRGMVRFYGKFFKHQYPAGLMFLVWTGVWVRFALVAGYLQMRLWMGKLGLRSARANNG